VILIPSLRSDIEVARSKIQQLEESMRRIQPNYCPPYGGTQGILSNGEIMNETLLLREKHGKDKELIKQQENTIAQFTNEVDRLSNSSVMKQFH
jgi:hypothetical protein